MKISIDAMGGDNAPQAILEGAALALVSNSAMRFLLHGDEAKLSPLLEKLPKLKAASEVIHTDKSIGMDEAPAQALRKEGRQSSMWRALESVAKGDADAAISAGNTGALMGMTKLVLKTLPGIDRPAIAARWPNKNGGQSLILDLGATISPTPLQLTQFAIMGVAAAQTLLKIDTPKVGLLNVGVEDIKGTPEVREAARLCRQCLPNNFHGFVEGDDISSGIVDVIVTDGFTGNVALKTAEGIARLMFDLIREKIKGSLLAKIGGIFLRPALRSIYERLEPGNYNGGPFLGLEGLALKSHGGCDAKTFASALEAAYILGQGDLTQAIRESLPRSQLDKLTDVKEAS